jgi:hypothetical protein
MKPLSFLLIGLFLFLGRVNLFGLDYVTLDRDGKRHSLHGRIMVTATDGGLLLQADNGILWTVQPEEIVERNDDDKPFVRLSREAIIKQLRRELPGFEFYETTHFVVGYNTTKAYAQWCGGLYERLYNGFHNYWRRRGAALQEPQWPLVALVFQGKSSYAAYAREELGTAAESIVGYYSLRTNRITTYDLTGSEQLRTAGSRPRAAARINQLLSRPQAEPTVATIIHEATHLLAYNSGLQRRYADNPLWLSEGVAVFFETPDLKSRRGWRGIGTINRTRLAQLQSYLPARPADSLLTLLRDDKRMQNGDTAINAYAESWALCYFLLRRYPTAFVEYLETHAGKTPLVYDSPQERIELFEKHFGDTRALDAEFRRYVEKLR